jgi:hypothetical protein
MSDAVLIRKSKALITVADFKDVLEKYQGSFGIAIADNNELTVQKGKLNFSKGVEAQAESLYNLQTDKDWSENARFTAFFSSASLSPESQQPFTIIGNGDDPQIVAYLSAGDYSKHAEANSLHTPAFFAMAKFLRPELVKLATRVDGDIDKLFELLDEDQKIEEMLVEGVFGPDKTGSFAIVLFDGRVVSIPCEKTPGISREWGWISTPPVTVKNADKPKLNLNTATDVPAKPRLNVATEQVTIKSGAEINATHKDAKPSIWARPKAGLTNKGIQQGYKMFHISRTSDGRGYIPNDWKNRVLVQVDPKYLSHRDFINSMEVVDNPTPDQLLASTSKKAVQTGTQLSDLSGLTVMSAKQKQEFLDDLTMKGYINASNTRSADDLKKDEVEGTSFFEATRLPLADLKKHSPASISYLIKTHPEVALIALRAALTFVPESPAAVASQQLPSADAVAAASSPGGKKPKLTLAM